MGDFTNYEGLHEPYERVFLHTSILVCHSGDESRGELSALLEITDCLFVVTIRCSRRPKTITEFATGIFWLLASTQMSGFDGRPLLVGR